MKKLLGVILLLAITTLFSQAQGLYTPSSTGFENGSTDGTLKTYGPFENITGYTVGVLYTSGATEDSLTTIEVYQAMDQTAAASRYGVKVSTDADFLYNSGTGSEYVEKSYTVTQGKYWISIYLNAIGTATDTFNVKPFLYVK